MWIIPSLRDQRARVFVPRGVPPSAETWLQVSFTSYRECNRLLRQSSFLFNTANVFTRHVVVLKHWSAILKPAQIQGPQNRTPSKKLLEPLERRSQFETNSLLPINKLSLYSSRGGVRVWTRSKLNVFSTTPSDLFRIVLAICDASVDRFYDDVLIYRWQGQWCSPNVALLTATNARISATLGIIIRSANMS